MRRVAAVLAILTGLTLIGFTVVEHLFTRADDAQSIADQYKGLMSTQGLADLHDGFAAVQDAGAQLATRAEPALQARLGMNDEQFGAYVARSMPGVAQFDAQVPGVVALVGPVIAKMEAERADYARAQQIPVSFLDLTSAPWLFLGIGFLLVAVGVIALVWPTTLATLALLVAGLGIVIAPLVVQIPSKVDAAVRVTAIGRIGLASGTGQKAVGATKLFDGMVDDVRTKLQPAFGDESPTFAEQFPTLAQFATTWHDSTSAKSHELSDSQVANAAKFSNADKIPLRPIPWMFIIPGIALTILAGASLVLEREHADADVPASALPATVPPA